MTNKWNADVEQTLHEALDAKVYAGGPGLGIDPEKTDLIDLTAFCLDAITSKYVIAPISGKGNDLRYQIASTLTDEMCERFEDQGECMTCDSSMVTCLHPTYMYCETHDEDTDVGDPCPAVMGAADAVLAVVRPLIAREKAEAWEEGHSWGWADYEDHATTMTLDLDGMPSRAEASTMRNPYEKGDDRG